MLIALWITAALLTVFYLLARTTEAFKNHEALLPQMPYVEDFSSRQVVGLTGHWKM